MQRWLITDHNQYFYTSHEQDWSAVYSKAMRLHRMNFDVIAPGKWETTYPSLACCNSKSSCIYYAVSNTSSVPSSWAVFADGEEPECEFFTEDSFEPPF